MSRQAILGLTQRGVGRIKVLLFTNRHDLAIDKELCYTKLTGEIPMKLQVLALATACLLAGFGAEARAQEVRVTLSGVEARAGKILASLQTEADFMQPRASYSLQIDPPARPGTVTLVFPNVAPGEYALSVMHDENGDYQMRMLSNGMPAEGYAMSHGGAMAGPPSFAVAKFAVGAAPVSFTEAMNYPYAPPAQ
jgi:uncharacterized protein (DUF2141 family)